jgi:hypothetical protein
MIVYVATRTLGVYYSDDFALTGSQPTWVTVNDGLPNTEVIVFGADPFDAENRQILLLDDPRTVYVRVNGGDWESLLTTAQARTVIGTEVGSIRWVCPDTAIPGHYYVSFMGDIDEGIGMHVLKSTDYGASWSASFVEDHIKYGSGNLMAHNGVVWTSYLMYAGAYGLVARSIDGMATWKRAVLGFSAPTPWFNISRVDPTVATGAGQSTAALTRYEDTGGGTLTLVTLQADIGTVAPDARWSSPTTYGHQRILYSSKIYYTDDAWETMNNSDAFDTTIAMMAEIPGDEVNILLGSRNYDAEGSDHTIMSLPSESSTTYVERAGSSPGTDPYTNSIPKTCGGVAYNGIVAVGATPGQIYVHAVQLGDDGTHTGIPMFGDRSAWDTTAFGHLHSADWDTGDSHHAALTLADGSAGTLTGQELDLTGVGDVIWYDEGALGGTASIINVTGDGGTVSVSGGTATLNITGGGGGGSVTWYDEGNLAGTASIVNVTGTGGTLSVSGGTATLDISGGSSGGGSVTVYDEGSIQGTVSIMDFTGSGVTASVSGGTATIDVSGTVLAEVAVYDEGVVAGTVSIFNFTGDGGTVSVSGGTATVNITGGGGGSVGYYNYIDIPPASPSVYDDEFSGTAIDGKWTWSLDPDAAGEYAVVENGTLHVVVSQDSAGDNLTYAHMLYQSIGDVDWVMTVKMNAAVKINFNRFGIFTNDGSITNHVQLVCAYNSTPYRWWDRRIGGTWTYSQGQRPWGSRPNYLRIAHDATANTLTMYRSDDGVGFDQMAAAYTYSGWTPSRIGLLFFPDVGSADLFHAVVYWFRVTL